MSTAILHPDPQKFPVGTTVKAYLRSSQPAVWDHKGPPVGAEAASATVDTDGSVTFTGLADATSYLLYAATPDRWSSFSTPAAPPDVASGADLAAETAARVAADAAIAAGAGAPNTRTADYTLVAGDAGKRIEVNSPSVKTVTVPPNASVAFAVGTIIEVCRLGAGPVNIAAGGGVTIHSRAGLLGIANQYSVVTLRKRATNEWVLAGDLVAAAFDPNAIPGLELWLAAGALSLADGDPVASWADWSSHGRDFAQAVAGAKPIYKASIINGLPVVRFDGVDDLIGTPANFAGANNQAAFITTDELTVIAAYQRRSAPGGAHTRIGALLGVGRNNDYDNPDGVLIGYEGPTNEIVSSMRDSAILSQFSPHPGNLSPMVTASWWDGADHTSEVNGADAAPAASAGPLAINRILLGGGWGGGGISAAAPADIAELLVYSTSLSAGNRAAAVAYLRAKYAI
jgi:hypothetical protein